MGKKILISPAHYILDLEAGNEYGYAAEIIRGIAQKDPAYRYFVLCGWCQNKESFPANIEFFEFFKTDRYEHNLKTRLGFYFWLLSRSIHLCRRHRFDCLWHLLPNGRYSLNPFILLNLHRLWGVKRIITGMLFYAEDSLRKIRDNNLVYDRGKLSASSKQHRWLYRFLWFFIGFFNRRYYKKFDHLIFPNHASRDCFESFLSCHFSDDKISIIPIGFDERKVSCRPKTPPPPYRFLFVGSLINRKRLDITLRLCALFKEKKVAFSLDIIGDGHQKEKLQALGAELGLDQEVRWRGFVSNDKVLNYYNQAHAVFLFSEQEGPSHVLLEAMASGTLFIGSAIPVNAEFIEHDRTGYLFQIKRPDFEQIAKTIMETSPAKWQRLTAAALAESRNYRWSDIIEKYYHIISADNPSSRVKE